MKCDGAFAVAEEQDVRSIRSLSPQTCSRIWNVLGYVERFVSRFRAVRGVNESPLTRKYYRSDVPHWMKVYIILQLLAILLSHWSDVLQTCSVVAASPPLHSLWNTSMHPVVAEAYVLSAKSVPQCLSDPNIESKLVKAAPARRGDPGASKCC